MSNPAQGADGAGPKTAGQIAYEAAIADLRYAPQWSDLTEDDRRSWGRAAAAILTAACKPWENYIGEPPDDGGPLISVFVAGMVYTERLLAKLLSVRNYESGDGSEDFDRDATQTLRNILTGAGLWDADENRPAALATPRTDSAERTAGEEPWTLSRAFDLGFWWGVGLYTSPQSMEDSRAVGRTLLDPEFDGLGIDLDGWDSFQSGDLGMCEGKRRIKEALDRIATPAPSSPGVPDSVRALTQREIDLEEQLREAVAFLEMDEEASKPGTDLYTWLKLTEQFFSAHPAGRSTGQGAETVWTHPHLPSVAKAAVAEAQAINAALAPDSPLTGPVGVEEALAEAYLRGASWWQRSGYSPSDPEGQALVRKAAGDYADLHAPVLAARPAAPEAQGAERVRHVKRGTEYEVLGEAEAQISKQDQTTARVCGDHARVLHEEDRLVVYRSVADGKLWCRFPDEFRDGRFLTLGNEEVRHG